MLCSNSLGRRAVAVKFLSTVADLNKGPRVVSPVLRAQGTGGRSSVSGIIATVFGSTGFLGRYVVNQLGRVGSTVFVAWRGDELDYRHLKVMGDLGQVNPIQIEARDISSLRRAIAGSNVVINLIGKWYDTRYYSLEDVNIGVAETIARLANLEQVEHFIHVSALTAHSNTNSIYPVDRWSRSKIEGERLVRQAFPRATIFRPADIWGMEDRFLNKIAISLSHLGLMPLVNGGRGQLQPVWVDDVARAIVASVRNPELTAGNTYELAGPRVMTRREVVEFVADATKRELRTLSIPLPLAKMLMRLAGTRLPVVNPNPLYTESDAIRETSDIVSSSLATDGNWHESIGTFDDLDIRPHDLLGDLGRNTLRQYRKGGDRSSLFFVD
ncbi:39kDa subunit of ndufa9, NADH:ubiquinone oxidoreductase [Cyanidiococcus yangmingshanensis]|uniref:39kDa subunit of ndufa9, NADH:ubiquinone oxidoreductase n=1 Tax=Cyanidiococcus yangmingshanensis TaxID=2690220 RepID=A0A7J7IJ28_9RHOD|nr:39kDa subunit of ndufa9, NADH:ubiquinone oxidoreductase [Cyanidiococcus yangmingshanensis]